MVPVPLADYAFIRLGGKVAKRNPVARALKDAQFKPRRTPTRREKLLREVGKAAKRLKNERLEDLLFEFEHGYFSNVEDEEAPF